MFPYRKVLNLPSEDVSFRSIVRITVNATSDSAIIAR